MVWERVDGGTLETGEEFVVEREVFHVHIPYSVEPLLMRRRRYRLRVQAPDGTFTEAAQVQARTAVDATRALLGSTEAEPGVNRPDPDR